MLHIYCGDGKGKTTAAIGLAVRGAGAGMRVRFVQLMKGAPTSELSVLENIPGVEIRRCDRDYGFFGNMSEADKLAITDQHNALLEYAFSDNAEMIILDEFCSAYNHGLMDKALAERLILENKYAKPDLKITSELEIATKRNTEHQSEIEPKLEIILTGRDPAKLFTDAADYISEIRCVRHPYKRGITARKGVEF